MPYLLPGSESTLVYRFGERGSGYKTKTGVILDFYKIKEGLKKENKKLFEDPNFPCEDASIYTSQPVPKGVEWKRPTEIAKAPKFFSGGASRFDVKQGELGDCWFLSAIASLTLNQTLFYTVAAKDNPEFGSEDYCGAFHFRFWKFGKWVDIVVDDRLPTRNGRLIFMHSDDANEFWSALIEKAYAKIHNSYESLEGGNVGEALVDFTGGVTEMCKIDEKAEASLNLTGGLAEIDTSSTAPPNLYHMMMKAFERSSFMGCSIDGSGDGEGEGPLGLITGHAYSITNIKTVRISKVKAKKLDQIQLLRIRNPWGNGAEWKGPWSDGSREWELLEKKEQKILLADEIDEKDDRFKADGEFWMSYQDFLKHFEHLDICNLGPDVMEKQEKKKKKKTWVVNAHEGAWVKDVTAGGCRNYPDSFHKNPQYLVQLHDPDEDDNDPKCTMIVSLMQKYRRRLGKDFLPIGYAILEVSDPSKAPTPLTADFVKKLKQVGSVKFSNSREISARFHLDPGTYCIIPSTFHPNNEGEFNLRVYTEKQSEMMENDDLVGIKEQEDDPPNVPNGDAKNESLTEAFNFFKKVAGDDMEVSWDELKDLLDTTFKAEFKFQGFSKDVCRSMLAVMDHDKSGKLGFDEFQLLWKSVQHWKDAFRKFDADNSGTLSSSELREALNSAGFKVNNKILQSLVLRYGNKNGALLFDDFIMCAIKLKCMVEVFNERVPDGGRQAMFTLDEWVDKTLYS